MKLYISPRFSGVDRGGNGGIRRVVDAQTDYFKNILVNDPRDADLVAIHAGSLVNLKASQKVVAHCHGLYWNKYDWGGDWHNDINKLVIQAMQTADAITAPTGWVANSLRRGMNRPIEVIGHGVDEQWRPGPVNLDYVLWNKSRIDKVCDPAPVYNVARMLPDVEFRMTVGSRYLPNIKITGLSPYADITPVQEAGCYLATAQETFGIGILEALACGVPVVGWNWGGQAELIKNEETGYLAEVGDYENLARGIIWCLTNRSRLRSNCVDFAKQYTWEKACKQYEELYERVYQEGQGRKQVSVIIRNYNLSEYLEDAINSCVDQLDQDDDELIVLDDCSTDNSKEVFDGLDIPEVDIRWVQTPRNLHLAGAQSYGISQSKGEYIVLLDADNMLAPNTIKILKTALDNDRSIDIAYGRIKFTRPDGKTPDVAISGARDGISSWPPSVFRLDRQLNHNNQISCTSMYRRRVYEHIGPYRGRCRVAEDADFWCRAVSFGFRPKLVTNAVTLIYRNRENTLSATTPDWPWHLWYDWQKSPPMCSLDNQAPNANALDNILVSVIIPVGPRHETVIQDALDSVYIQTFKNWECIVVNDTGKALPWVPPWAIVIDTPGNIGTAAARNLGLANSKAKLWIPLDADDYLEKNALEKLLRAYAEYGGYIYSDWKKAETHEIVKVPKTSCDKLVDSMPHLVTGLYPVVKDIKFDTSLKLLEDWDFAIQMVSAGHCGTAINEPLVYYRQATGSRRRSDSEEHRIALENKWRGNMPRGCSTCGSRHNIGTPAPQNAGNVIMGIEFDPANMTQLEYLGAEEKRYFTGQSTGQSYAFGTLSLHRIKYVWNADVPGFLANPNWQVYAGELNPV